MEPERRLLVLYVSCLVCGLASSASLTIVWLYWDPSLDSCIDVDCGCVLYSVVTFSTFVGGAVWLCRYSTLAQLPLLVWATTAALYHAYRICVPKKVSARRRTVTFNEDGTRRALVGQRAPPQYSVLTVLGVVSAVLSFAQAWIITSGYLATCYEYRKTVAVQLNANGDLARLVFERMSCSTVFDFLDYLQPDPPLLDSRYRRSYVIHTAHYLHLSMAASWADCALWTFITAYNLYLTLRKPNKQ